MLRRPRRPAGFKLSYHYAGGRKTYTVWAIAYNGGGAMEVVQSHLHGKAHDFKVEKLIPHPLQHAS